MSRSFAWLRHIIDPAASHGTFRALRVSHALRGPPADASGAATTHQAAPRELRHLPDTGPYPETLPHGQTLTRRHGLQTDDPTRQLQMDFNRPANLLASQRI